MTGSMLYAAIDVRGRPRFAEGTGGNVVWRSVTPGYFSALRIPILRGRGFREDDRDPKRTVVILSDALARRMFPGENALDHEIRPGRTGEWLSIVGIADNVKNNGLMQPNDPEYYVPRKHSAEDAPYSATVILRSADRPDAVARAMRAEITALDETVPVEIESMGQRIGRLSERPRFEAPLLGISQPWARSSRWSVSMEWLRSWWRSGPRRSGSGWLSERRAARLAGSCLGRPRSGHSAAPCWAVLRRSSPRGC